MRKIDRRRKLVSDINIVPFTDVLLVLLVIFMVTTPLIVQGQIQVKLPKATAAAKPALKPVVLTLTAQGRIFLGDQEVSLDQVQSLLVQALKERGGDKQVIIQADRAVTHGRVVALMDLAKQAGAERLAIATEGQP
jgi:biopolymer transport protein TolR